MKTMKTKVKPGEKSHEDYVKKLDSLKRTCCQFCNCACYDTSLYTHPYEIPLLPRLPQAPSFRGRKKRTKSKPRKRSKSANSSRRDCDVLKSILPQEDVNISSRFNLDLGSVDVCNSMANLCLSSRKVLAAFESVPKHDKLIVNRMARSRSEKALLEENSWLAQKHWQNEKYERELFKCEQKEEFKKAVHEKRFVDYQMTKARIEELAKRDLEQLQALKEVIKFKDYRLQKRLNNIRQEREVMQHQKRELEQRKSEFVQQIQQEKSLDNQLKLQDMYMQLENRQIKAKHIRENHMDSYLKRLKHDNYLQQIIHQENYREAKSLEDAKKRQLVEKICEKKMKSDHFIDKKRQQFESLSEQARLSSELRHIVRYSISPEIKLCERSLSNLSCRKFC